MTWMVGIIQLMGNSKSQDCSWAKLKELSDDDLTRLKELPIKNMAPILSTMLSRAIKQNNTVLIQALRNPSFLQSILFKEIGGLKHLENFLRLLQGTWTKALSPLFPQATEIGPAIFVIVMSDMLLPEHAFQHLGSEHAADMMLEVLNVAVGNNMLSIGSSAFSLRGDILMDASSPSYSYSRVAQVLTTLSIVKDSIKDKLRLFIKDHPEIFAKFPIILNTMSPQEVSTFISCIESLDDYMIDCIVDYFSAFIRAKLPKDDYYDDRSFLSRSQLIKIMDTRCFEEWTTCFSICVPKNNLNNVKTRLKRCPYTLMVENIVYALERYAK